MSSRFPPSSGFNSRDRSPQRFGERRPPAGPRGPDDGSPSSFGREPPRGPRALVDSPRGGPFSGGGRGRGYGRGDFRDRDRDVRDRERDRERDFRDTRDAPPFRREVDRDWGRRDRDFDPRESRMGFSRGRSRSPARDFRDMRDPPGRDFDLVRMRRNSRDSILSASSGGADGPPSSGGHHARGGSVRGRGRGDWEGGRGRGRPPYPDDRETFRRRSRSRDGWRDRDRDWGRERLPDRERERDVLRDREWERDRDMDRRDRFDRREDWDARQADRDDRDWPAEPWKRERPPSRAGTRAASGSTTASLPHAVAPGFAPPDRKPSIVAGAAHADARRDAERPEPAKDLASIVRHSPPPAAPQVPAFGSMPAPVPTAPAAKTSPHENLFGGHFLGEKERNEPTRPPAQPPTGPKAERGELPLDPRSQRESLEGDHQLATPNRAVKASTGLSDLSPPTAPAAMAKRDSVSGPGESLSTGRASSVTTSPKFARLPQPAPRAQSREPSISPRMQSSSIPTGPRAFQQRQALPQWGPKGSKQWVRPGYSRTPSIPNVPPKPEPFEDREHGPFPGDEQRRPIARPIPSDLLGEPQSGGIVEREVAKAVSPEPAPMNLPLRQSPGKASMAETEGGHELEQDGNEGSALIPDFGGSSDEEDDENIVFTQDYLEERKRIFEKDMQMLRAEMPPPPLEDPAIVALLMRIQLLGMVAHNEVPGRSSDLVPSVEEAEETPKAPDGDKFVSFAPAVVDRRPVSIVKPAIPPVAPVDEITLEGLPFLHSGPPTPLSDLEVCHENATNREHLKDAFRAELSKRKKELAKKNAALREEYLSYYKPWRLSVWERDRLKDQKKSVTPTPASPPPSTVAATPAPVPEGREGRRYKGNSELDFLNALKASEISAQEELERRRTRMATAHPDLSREAVIPDMLEPREEKARVFKDVNNVIDPDQAMDVFKFLPPSNDFTPEEHVIFTDAFMAHPKRWGKIAESLPGRDFQQCIIHYYLTKEEIKYKAKLNKRWSRRGRGKTKSSRPKSNALIADLGVVKPDFEGDEDSAPVTDTGRPRRAAAPTFGDSNDTENGQTVRRGQIGREGEPAEKPAGRRGARAGGARSQRRAKAALQELKVQGQAAQGGLPLTGKLEIGADAMAEVLPQDKEAVDKELAAPIPRGRAGRGRAKEGVYVFESNETEPTMSAKSVETGYGSLQPTSYWSVPEQRDFPQLLAHFGRDFEGISNFMKTKTTVMVKNYYQRRLDSGKKDFEEILLIAEDKKARGEPAAPLPIPSVAPKRRYEATPSSIVPRPLAPHGDHVAEMDEARFSVKGKPTALSPQTVPLSGRPLSDKDRNASRFPPLAQATAASTAHSGLDEDASRAIRTQAVPPPRMPGPRLGYFSDDRRDSVLSHPTPRTQDMQLPSRHTPGPMSSDIARMDPLSAQSLRPSLDTHAPSSLLQTQAPLGSSQQAYMAAQQPPPFMPPTHAGHPSLTQPPGSPAQPQRAELDLSSVHRESFSQRQFYSLPGQSVGHSHSPRPVLSPVKDVQRQSATPAPEPASRHVPAKRSNIMSILNDEPEEPQPRKRFASEQVSAIPASGPTPMSRSVYPVGPSIRQEETPKPPGYSQSSQYSSHSRGYDYPGFGSAPGGTGTSANNDWMARFDPRAPPLPQAQARSQQPPQGSRQPTSLASQTPFSHYAPGPTQPSGSSGNLPVPSSPAPTPPPPPTSQRSSYPNVLSQPTAQTPTASGSRELPSQHPSYRSGSPLPRASSIAYGARSEPATSSTLFGMSPRYSGAEGSYGSAVPSSATAAQPHGQSYQQHVQTLVNGAHQPPSHRSSPTGLPGGPLQYRHSTPPPQTPGSRANITGSMPSLAGLGRSYTPPSAPHPSASGGWGYSGPPSSGPGSIPPHHQRPPGPGSLSDPVSAPSHLRAQSQGSTQSGLPGPLHPSSQPPR